VAKKTEEVMGNFKKHILVADNDPDSLAAVQFNMKMAGYLVFTANNPKQAKEMLDEQIIHLAIIDMRLTNDKELEYSGFDVAAHVPSYVPFIIYTAFEDTQSVRRALGKFGAKESLDKKRPGAASELVETVERLFKSDVKINFDLEIQGSVTCEDIAEKIEITSHERSQPPAEDVCQILQSLFWEANSISISPMFSPEAQPAIKPSGSVVVLVRPHYKDGWGEARVVKFSEMLEIEQEEKKYRRIEPFLGGMRLAVLGGTAYSRKIGGLIYTLIDGKDWESIRLFSDYFRDSDKETISLSLERFFCQTFGTIFTNAVPKLINITKDYCDGFHLTPQKLIEAMQVLRPAENAEAHLRFEGLNGNFPNPVVWILPDGEFRKIDVISKACLCHGDLHGRNILVNSNGDYWLIDFARVDEEAHALRDFVELETDIKFNLMKDADLTALLPFEYALLTPQRFKDEVPEANFNSESLAKAYKVIATLRQVAAKSLVLNDDMSEYYEALLVNTLNILRLRHIQAAKKEHALLSASLLCQRLDHWPEWDFVANYGASAS
jgi:CheY-like chemotaxis protein